MSDWKSTQLGDLCDPARGITYGIVKVGDYVPGGIPVIRGGDIRDGRIVFNEEKRVSIEVSNQFKRTILRGDEIVLNLIAEPGHSALAPASMAGYNVSRDVAVIPLINQVNTAFVSYFLRSPVAIEWLTARLQGSVTQKINLGTLRQVPVPTPPRAYQNAVAVVLGALDDKIAVNDRVASTSRLLAQTRFRAAIQSSDAVECDLASISGFLSRGIAPRYTDDSKQLVVLNQKCIRDGLVSLGPSRRTEQEMVPSHQKLLQPSDILVNSTGVGTLGRVARWLNDIPATVDSHVTIVRIDPNRADPVCAGFALLAAQQLIESLGEGSTGQTELSRARLGALTVRIPDGNTARHLRPELDALEARGKAALVESNTLAKLRDTLLPKLMSGEIRVRDGERIVEGAT